jgi:hypothetical protein
MNGILLFGYVDGVLGFARLKGLKGLGCHSILRGEKIFRPGGFENQPGGLAGGLTRQVQRKTIGLLGVF